MRILRFIHFGIIALIGISILYLIAFKAYYSSFTHDESFSYLHYVPQSFMDILAFKDSYTNNHILNSLGMKYSEMIFGTSEFSLRLPNIILSIVYCIFSFLLFKKSHKIIAVSFFVFLLTNNSIIDFFGLARGYGLSIGFMMMAIYYLIEALNSGKNKNLVLFHLAALLATLSNFTMLNFYVASIITFYIVIYIEQRIIKEETFSFFKSRKLNWLWCLISIIVLYEPVRRLITYNKLDFGGKSGFINDTISSVINYTFSNLTMSNSIPIFLMILCSLLIIFTLGLIIKKFAQKKLTFFQEHKALVVVNALIILISLASIIQHFLFHTDFLSGRFALFLVPLLLLNIGFLVNYLITVNYKKIVLFVIALLAISSAYNFYSHFNMNSNSEWAYDANTKKAMQQLTKQHQVSDSISLGVSWELEPTCNFYRTLWKLNWVKPIERYSLKNNSNFYYVFVSSITNHKITSRKAYTCISYFDDTKSILLKAQ